MSPIRSAASRSLRSKLLARSPRIFNRAERNVGIAAAMRSTPPEPMFPTSFLPPDFHHSNFETPLPRIDPAIRSPQDSNAFNYLLTSLTQTLTPTQSPDSTLPILHNIFKSYASNTPDWSQFAHVDPNKQYTRNLVYSVPGVFNLLLLVWNPGKESPVHDHADAHCLMKVLKGTITESRFAMPERPGEQGPLQQTSRKDFKLDQVSYMADILGLHSISNPHPTEHAVSLHLYTPPNAALRGCNVYDTTSGGAKHVAQNVYDSVNGRLPE